MAMSKTKPDKRPKGRPRVASPWVVTLHFKISDDVRARLERERDGRRVPFSLNAIAREAMIIGLEALEKGK